MNEPSPPLTKSQAIGAVVAQMTAPLELDEITNRVLALWPSKAKNAKAGIRQTLRFEFLGKSLIFVDKNNLIPTHLAMPGVCFRVPLARQEIQRGVLFVFPAFQFMTMPDLSAEDFLLEEAKGRSIPLNLATVQVKTKTLFGVQTTEHPAFDLKWWYKKHALRRGHSLLVTVLDWEKGRFRLEPESARARRRHRDEIQAQNQALADHLFQQLEAARDEDIWGQIAIPTAYLHLKAANAYPADHWLEVLERDPRMKWTGYEIRYADWVSPLESVLHPSAGAPAQGSSLRKKRLSKEEAPQIYRFKAALRYNKRLWRRIEIQGGQTLSDFDVILRTAFQHDHTDHLSGFWKLVRRGQSRRFREVDLGTINPFEGGGAAAIKVAALSLIPGDALKYVYDFGDWIEHRLELEGIGQPEENVTYPRITGQNKPRYRYCQYCKDEGRKSRATWFCYTCSDEEQRRILLCETCSETHDEDHYLDEIIY
ncbi:MAG: hypothetical protein PVF74_11255 [Anaerolineales bacterium]|jgi:hypothetical protein